MISLRIDGENFLLPRDKGYIASKELIPGDYVMIQYFIDNSRPLTPDEKKKIVKLEVVQ
jgi:hypothetical protein